MTPKQKSIVVIAAITAILLWIGGWWIDHQKASMMEEIHQQKGIIQNLKDQLTKKAIEGNRLKQIADSAIAISNKVDTVFIKPKYDKNFSNIRQLGSNALIGDLAKRLPK